MIEIQGIVNLTDDSFYAKSRLGSAGIDEVVSHCARMIEEGADILDFGACSSRPGSMMVGAEEEWRRLKEALRAVRQAFPKVRISVDTYWAEVVRRVYDLTGPFMVNDISSGEMDPQMLPLVGSLHLPYIAMHMRGTPQTMGQLTDYGGDVVGEIKRYFETFRERAEGSGIDDWILDPGFGFAKTREQNWELLRRLGEFRPLGRKILVGISRKSMLGTSAENALEATQKAHRIALEGGADMLRVHDVAAARETVRSFYSVK